MIEEFGDVLWYFTNTATRAGLHLRSLAQDVLGSAEEAKHAATGTIETFRSMQSHKSALSSRQATEAFEISLIRLAGRVGVLLYEFSQGNITQDAERLTGHLIDIFRLLLEAAHVAGIDLQEAAERNLAKIFDRWPGDGAPHTPLFDAGFEPDEQLPRHFEVSFQEKTIHGKTFVLQKCGGINIGDRLTDNMTEDDGYRFHDVFHLAYAAILGWSPVTRALFRCKRKSDPAIDEVEDGARALITEEGISAWVFTQAVRLDYFEELDSLSYGLLKLVRDLVKGFEVERCALWEWEKAILAEYRVFRLLRMHWRGIVVADLINRQISFRELP